jgi:cobalt-zinc-cadmium efflux system protein
VLLVTGVVLVVEIVGAWLTGSLALLADAGHMATDAGAVVLALGASYLAARPGSERSTFGYHRVEVMAALANAVVLLGVCAYLGYAGIARLVEPAEVEGAGMVGFALVGLLANAVALVILSRGANGERSLNLRGALNEVVADLLGSVLAVLAGAVIVLWDWHRADPVASLVIAVMVLPRALLLIRDSGRVLLEIAPADLDLADVRHHLLHAPGVVGVHDLHAWTITSGMASLSAHVTVTDDALAEHGVGAILDHLGDCLATHFDLHHTTLQIEPESHQEHEYLGEMHGHTAGG